MLSQIQIRNYAIIDTLELDLSNGMTVLTGETGAGKSILVDALSLVLGDRADSAAVRHGQEKAEISAVFDVQHLPQVQEWLNEHELDADGECVLRRVITAEGRSKGFINGRPAPAQLLQEAGEMLVDIHGQHQHQSLLRTDVQRQLLDDYAKNQTLLSTISNIAQRWKNTAKQLEQLRQAARDRDARLELLRFHVNELETLNLAENELTELDAEHKRLANGGAILERCSRAIELLSESDDQNLLTLINRALNELEPLRVLDPKLGAVCQMLDDASIQIQESSSELRSYLDRIELDPSRLTWIEQRLGVIHDLARKHRIEPARLPALLTQYQTELSELDQAEIRLEALDKELQALAAEYLAAAKKLTQQRNKAAKELSKAVTDMIRQLGMPASNFQIALTARTENTPHPQGQEQIAFEVSANPGQPPRPLAKVASGGELSRIALAIQVLLTEGQHIPTLIFDEVDTGIGGGVAETVGRQLRTLGQRHQVLCVTHLPQVAALGHHHLQVSKKIGKDSTATQITVLTPKQRQEEIARMLGGQEITTQSRAHAEEMISRATALA
ncbi:MAG: DNA repair protein RecN [Gammaproteobacteria bacterium]|nr:DNA repair protein RecN [Gammaproteobacteria bacterium]